MQIVRGLALAWVLLSGTFTVAMLFPFYGSARRRQAVCRWSRQLLAALDVELRVRGGPPPPGRPAVMVSNHVSWLDIHLVHAIWQVRFVAKSEVRRWPLIGWLSARTGTLFIERGRGRHAAHINRAIHAAFSQGDAIGVFPEGTTSDGSQVQRFHASLLQPAVDEQALVHPVALRYLDGENRLNVNASYVGETSLLESMLTILAEKKIIAELTFLPAIEPAGKTRRHLAEQTRAAIAAALASPMAGDQEPALKSAQSA
ncbi:MAG: lysophospholipid acyltransferase family protein [Burkholderiales bacterium]